MVCARITGAAAAISAACSIWCPTVAIADAPKWGAHVDVEGKLGTDRDLGEVDLFLPIAQNHDTLLFANIRARADDQGSHEGNFGLGLRRMFSSGWNIGAYGYYDRRGSDSGKYFDQATFGIEVLGRDFDLRANGYVPFGDRVKTLGFVDGGPSTADIVGTTIQITTPGDFTFEERALEGFDAEVGWRVPLWSADDNKALRLYAGMFHFDDSVVEAITGPRFRAELTMYELPYLPDDARLTLGAEYQDDDVRGSQAFAMGRLRIPLQSESTSGRPLTWQERRMTDYVVRDIDVVTQARTAQAPALVETATADGINLTVISSAGVAGAAALNTALADAGANSTVILQGTFITTAPVNLQTGQTVMGGGSVTVRSPSGRTATLIQPSGATISATLNGGETAVSMADNSTLTGMTINPVNNGNGSVFGVEATGVAGVTIANNTVTITGDSAATVIIGIRLFNGATGTVTGNSVTATNVNTGGAAVGLHVVNSTATAIGNSFNASSSNSEFASYNDNATLSGEGNTLTVFGSGTTSRACRVFNTTGTSFGYDVNSECGNVNQ